MGNLADRLATAGFELPQAPRPAGAYVPAVRAGLQVYTAGQLPTVAGSLLTTGLVGKEVTPDVARQCAEKCVLNALAAAGTVCDLDNVAFVAKMTGYVASAAGFYSQPAVIDAASSILAVAFPAGGHAREAVGVAALPLNAPVEISLILQLLS